MVKSLFIGFRVEVISRIVATDDLIKQYNSKHTKTQLFDLHRNGKITIEKTDGMFVARGAVSDRAHTGLVNFSVLTELTTKKEVERIVQIVNVLGNGRLIRESVSVFVSGGSVLNGIPEFQAIRDAFVALEVLAPGLVKNGWYYAPEAILK